MNLTKRIKKLYSALLKNYKKQNWWPAESVMECIIGTILTQNTSWNNVEKAINNLKSRDKITLDFLKKTPLEELAILIKPSGFYNQKALTIKNLIKLIDDKYDGKIKNMFDDETDVIRNNLLQVKGIGNETADCIILYALKRPVFVIDKYSHRILHRHGIIPKNSSYLEMQKIFIENLDQEPSLFNEFHALIVKVGKRHCKTVAECTGCPLKFDLKGKEPN